MNSVRALTLHIIASHYLTKKGGIMKVILTSSCVKNFDQYAKSYIIVGTCQINFFKLESNTSSGSHLIYILRVGLTQNHNNPQCSTSVVPAAHTLGSFQLSNRYPFSFGWLPLCSR